MLENAFVDIADVDTAQQLANDIDVPRLHALLDRFAHRFCPVIERLGVNYHWSLMQVECSTDIIFKRQSDLGAYVRTITRTAIHAVKAGDVATFLGRKLHPNYQDQLGNDFSKRIEETRIKHYMGPASIKMYGKAKIVLRIETTANDVSFFKHYRKVEQRDGTIVHKDAPLKKCIYSLPDLRELLAAANRRYLEFISQLEDPSSGSRNLDKVTQTVVEQGRTYKGFNFFSDIDLRLSLAVLRGEHSISGLRNKDLQRHLCYRSNWLMAIKSLSLMVIKCSVGMRRYNDAHRLTTLPACSLLATSRSRHARRARQACARLRVVPSAQLPFAARAGKPFVWAMGGRMPPAGAPDPGCSTSNILSEIGPYKPIYLDR